MEPVLIPISFSATGLCSAKIDLQHFFVYTQMLILVIYLLNLGVSKIISLFFNAILYYIVQKFAANVSKKSNQS